MVAADGGERTSTVTSQLRTGTGVTTMDTVCTASCTAQTGTASTAVIATTQHWSRLSTHYTHTHTVITYTLQVHLYR